MSLEAICSQKVAGSIPVADTNKSASYAENVFCLKAV